MGRMIDRFRILIGFTPDELKVIFFLCLMIITGLLYNYYSKPVLKIVTSENPVFDSLYSIAMKSFDDSIKYIEKVSSGKSPLLDLSKININTASIEQLEKLPGIGLKTAEKIISYRNKIGKFQTAEQIMMIKGIGEKKFSKLKKYITV